MTRRRLAFVVVLAAGATAPSSTDDRDAQTRPETFDRKLGDDVRVTATDIAPSSFFGAGKVHPLAS